MVFPDVPFCRFVVSMPSMMKRFSEPDAPSIWMAHPAPQFPDLDSCCAPGARRKIVAKSRPLGIRSMVSFDIDVEAEFPFVSMSGEASAVTVTASATPASARTRSTVKFLPRSTTTSDGLPAWKP